MFFVQRHVLLKREMLEAENVYVLVAFSSTHFSLLFGEGLYFYVNYNDASWPEIVPMKWIRLW